MNSLIFTGAIEPRVPFEEDLRLVVHSDLEHQKIKKCHIMDGSAAYFCPRKSHLQDLQGFVNRHEQNAPVCSEITILRCMSIITQVVFHQSFSRYVGNTLI